MKNLLLTLLFVCFAAVGFAQTDGLSYQAVIIDENPQEIPGADISGNYLADAEIGIRFTIFNSTENIEYQEEQQTQTDPYGMVNLVIGQGDITPSSSGEWDEINWDGTPKELMVELDYKGSGFKEFSREQLLFIPYVYHRDIYASGTLIVDGETVLNDDFTVANQSMSTLTGDLLVQGTATFEGDTYFNTITVENWSLLHGTLTVNDAATFNSSLSVLNQSPSYLSGSLMVDGETNLNSNLNVQGVSSLYGPFIVYDEQPSWLTGALQVDGNTTISGNTNMQGNATVTGSTVLNGTLTANSTSALNGQVTIDADVNGEDTSYDAYPLRVQGSNQGIAIRLDGASQNAHNFATFFDNSGTVHGRIEGQTLAELYLDFDYIWKYAGMLAESFLHGVEAGACLASPVPDVAESIVNIGGAAVHLANSTEWIIQQELDLGVTFESGGADYAEWLEKADTEETFSPGDVVGVSAGMISKRVENADHILVISTNPVVLGNIPPAGREADFEKVAFLGQVPITVVGSVNTGDYILPSGSNDGLARAEHPENLSTLDFGQIIGVAWEAGSNEGLNRINMAIGMHGNVLARRVSELEQEMSDMKKELAEIRAAIQRGTLAEDQSAEKSETQKEEVNKEPIQVQSVDAEPFTDEEFEIWLEQNREVIEREMEKIREMMNTRNIDYTRDERLAKLIDDPFEALRQMRSGEFMGSLWKSYEEKYNNRQ